MNRFWRKTLKIVSSIKNFGHRVEQTRVNTLRGLTPEVLMRQLDEFRYGRFSTVGQTFELIADRNPILKTTKSKREKSVGRLGFEVLTPKKNKENPDAPLHQKYIEYLFNNLTATDATDEDETGDISLLVRQMMKSLGVKYAVHEIVWQPQADGFLTAELRFVPLWFFEHSKTKLRFLREQGQWDGEEMLPGEWMVTVGDNLMVASAIYDIFRRLSFQDWSAFNEKFGIPGIIGKTTAKPGSAEHEAMQEAVANMANEFAAVMSEGEHIEFLERKSSTHLPFQPMVDICDRYIASLWRGGDLSTSSSKDGMGASLQAEETAILLEDDIKLISGTLQTKFVRPAIEYRFGKGVEPLVYIELKSPQADTTDLDIKVDEHLLKYKFPISQEDMAERYQRGFPDEKETLLESSEEEEEPGAEDKKQGAKEKKPKDKEALANEATAGSQELGTAHTLKTLVAGAMAEELQRKFHPLMQTLLASDLSEDDLLRFRERLPELLISPTENQGNDEFTTALGKMLSQAFTDGAAESPTINPNKEDAQ